MDTRGAGKWRGDPSRPDPIGPGVRAGRPWPRLVAGETFRPVNRIVARIETIRDVAAPAAGTKEKEGTR